MLERRRGPWRCCPARRLARDQAIIPSRVHACLWVDSGGPRETSSEMRGCGTPLPVVGSVPDSSICHSESTVSHSPPHSGHREADLCGLRPPTPLSSGLEISSQWETGGLEVRIWSVSLTTPSRPQSSSLWAPLAAPSPQWAAPLPGLCLQILCSLPLPCMESLSRGSPVLTAKSTRGVQWLPELLDAGCFSIQFGVLSALLTPL